MGGFLRHGHMIVRRVGLATGFGAIAILAAGTSHAATPAGGAGSLSYSVRSGDTLYDLAKRYMQRTGDALAVQRINRISRDRAIPPGTVISIPYAYLKYEPLKAQVLAFRGDVRINAQSASLDRSIAEGDIVETGAGASLTLGLSNGSRVALPTQSRLRIVAMRRYLLGNHVDFDFLVERGRIETDVSKLPTSGSRYRVRTPISVSAVRGTHFRVAYDAAAPALTEVVEGTVGVNAPRSTIIPVPKGFGVAASANGSLAKKPLLPAPTPIRPGKLQSDPLVTLALEPQPGAAAYRVAIAADAGFIDQVAEARAGTPTLSVADLPDGRYFVRATAIAPDGMEGLPRNFAMRRLRADMKAGADASGAWVFKWASQDVPGRVYHFQLVPKAPAALPLIDEPGIRAPSIRLSAIPPGTYVWRVGIRDYGAPGLPAGEVDEAWLSESELLVSAPE